MNMDNRVQFEKPDLHQLTQRHTVVDMHFHSHYSDGLNSVAKIAARARDLGIGIAVTDHNDIRGAIEIDRYTDVFSIPGIEVTVSEGSHVLIYFEDVGQLKSFYDAHVVPQMGHGVMSSLKLSMIQTIECARQYDCLIVFPHPYCAMFTGVCNAQFSQGELQNLLNLVDGVEVINASNLNKWNLRCAVLGFNLGKTMLGGSDGHALNHMGRAVSVAHCPKTRRDFLNSVRWNATQAIGREMTFLRKVTSNGLKLRSNMCNCQDLLEKNIRYSRKVISLKSRSINSNIRRGLNACKKQPLLRNYFSY
jgi:predicted metal-dependent phosphoesterase TrpH